METILLREILFFCYSNINNIMWVALVAPIAYPVTTWRWRGWGLVTSQWPLSQHLLQLQILLGLEPMQCHVNLLGRLSSTAITVLSTRAIIAHSHYIMICSLYPRREHKLINLDLGVYCQYDNLPIGVTQGYTCIQLREYFI